MSFPVQGNIVTLQGAEPVEFAYTIIELSIVTDENAPVVLPEIQELVDQYKDVFAIPVGLPPERACDHSIPLIPGARPFSLRPYRLAPELKDEVEKQIQEMLEPDLFLSDHTASKVAEVFLDRVYRLHGLPLSLVSDHDPIFTSSFWKELCNRTGIKL